MQLIGPLTIRSPSIAYATIVNMSLRPMAFKTFLMAQNAQVSSLGMYGVV